MNNEKIPILLIEDNPADAELTRIFLESSSLKHELSHSDSLYEGIEILKNNNIELVLLDLSLNDTIGFKTLKTYLEKAPNVPVIVLTGTNNEIMGMQAVKAGAQDFLVKGEFDSKLLVRAIRYSSQRFKMQLKLQKMVKQLQENEKRYKEAQEMAKFGNWDMDIVSNSMTWTDEIFRIFGFQPNNFSPTLSDYMKYVHVEDKEKVDDFFEQTMKTGKLQKLEHRIVIDNRIIKYLAIWARVNVEETTNKIFLIGGLQDISDRKLTERLILEKHLNDKTDQLKEEVLSEMSFHIRTPLSSIVNLLYLLENSTPNTQEKELIDDLKTSVDDLSIMINNLLNFSLILRENVKVEEKDFNLKEMALGLNKVAKIKSDHSKILLNFEYESGLPEHIISDPTKINQILYNLIDNAIKYTDEGGEVSIEIAGIRSQNKLNAIKIRVSDTGNGIPKDRIKLLMEEDQLLQLYSEDKDADKKYQLGIAIVAKLTRLLQGDLKVKSKDKQGTIFDLEIPVKEIAAAKQKGLSELNRNINILLVEDHFLNQIATKKVLNSWSNKVSVEIAENGEAGVALFIEKNFDLILMDIQMPIMNGIEAADKIRQKSEIPIIALTANSSKQEQEKCFEVGMNDYLTKPFKPQELYTKILGLLS
jgi:CheY-like chemotaxis protein